MSSLAVNGICRLTSNPEIRLIKDGPSGWIQFGIAAWRESPKEGQQEVDFFNAEGWIKDLKTGKHTTLKKGSLIYLDRALLRNNVYTKDNQEKSYIKISIFNFDIINAHEKITDKELKPIAVPDAKVISIPEPEKQIPEPNKPTTKKEKTSNLNQDDMTSLYADQVPVKKKYQPQKRTPKQEQEVTDFMSSNDIRADSSKCPF